MKETNHWARVASANPEAGHVQALRGMSSMRERRDGATRFGALLSALGLRDATGYGQERRRLEWGAALVAAVLTVVLVNLAYWLTTQDTSFGSSDRQLVVEVQYVK